MNYKKIMKSRRLKSKNISLFNLAIKIPSSNHRGQGLIEYLIIVALIGVATISVMGTMGQNVTAQFSKVANSIQGKKTSDIQFKEVTKSQYRSRDMSDFFRGATKRAGSDE